MGGREKGREEKREGKLYLVCKINEKNNEKYTLKFILTQRVFCHFLKTNANFKLH